ncbi:MAG: XRE family transcriptional regulator [Planctomycetaceae bacterium]|nr:XRE family transcriptional regulator [Planctomycetaceae bacterium]
MVNGNNVRKARKSLAMTQSELAARCRCATNTIGRIERDQLQPSAALAQQIAQTLGVPLEFLETGSDPGRPSQSGHLRSVLHLLVEKLSDEEMSQLAPAMGYAPRRRPSPAAAEPALPPGFDIVDVEQLPADWPSQYLPIIGRLAAGQGLDTTEAESYPAGLAYQYLRYAGAPHNAFALIIEGQSMLPRFCHGDVVIVDPNHTVDGGICAVLTDDGTGQRSARLKRLVVEGSQAHLESLNPAYPSVTLPSQRVQAYAIWRHLTLSVAQPHGSAGYRWL